MRFHRNRWFLIEDRSLRIVPVSAVPLPTRVVHCERCSIWLDMGTTGVGRELYYPLKISHRNSRIPKSYSVTQSLKTKGERRLNYCVIIRTRATNNRLAVVAIQCQDAPNRLPSVTHIHGGRHNSVRATEPLPLRQPAATGMERQVNLNVQIREGQPLSPLALCCVFRNLIGA